jgi:hypothetical protein
VKLFEHPDFDQVILQAVDYFEGRGLHPAVIEKDYYVIEALRIIAATAGDKVIFKGGTSLSKGWNLIQRFSADSADNSLVLPPLRKRSRRDASVSDRLFHASGRLGAPPNMVRSGRTMTTSVAHALPTATSIPRR